MNLIFNFLILNDYPEKWQLSFQDPATSIMENIIDLHHDIMFFLIIITILTLWMLFRIITLFNVDVKHTKRFLYLTHNNFIEIFWTIIPTIILFLIALPSYTLIYNLDNLNDPLITLKIIGHQWYWTYEYPDLNWDVKLDDENNVIKDYLTFDEMKTKNVIFDSYMIAENDIENNGYRLLDVDNCIVLPIEINVRLIITASDVIHSWTIPSLGVKLDATPGRLNQVGITVLRTSYFYGQCSELCGLNHSFMPIALKTVNSAFEFEMWLIQKNDWFGKNIINQNLENFLIFFFPFFEKLKKKKYILEEKIFGKNLTEYSKNLEVKMELLNIEIEIKKEELIREMSFIKYKKLRYFFFFLAIISNNIIPDVLNIQLPLFFNLFLNCFKIYFILWFAYFILYTNLKMIYIIFKLFYIFLLENILKMPDPIDPNFGSEKLYTTYKIGKISSLSAKMLLKSGPSAFKACAGLACFGFWIVDPIASAGGYKEPTHAFFKYFGEKTHIYTPNSWKKNPPSSQI